MDKIKVVMDATVPNYSKVKDALESNGIEVVLFHDRKNFDEELSNRFQELKEFEMEFSKNFKMPLGVNQEVEPYYVKHNKAKF